MNFNLLNKVIAGIVFIISFIVLFMTVQPSVSFWDCGEFIAASVSLQVPHPPGTPFFLQLGNIFSKDLRIKWIVMNLRITKSL